MNSLEKKREEFRRYLENAGAIDNLTKALIKLYEQQNKPSDAVKFIRKHMCESCPDDDQFEVLSADLERANKKICELERELSRLKGSVKRTYSEIDLALAKGLEELSLVDSKSLLRKYLLEDIAEELKTLKTKFKGNLLDCVQSGLEILYSPIGAFACDPEAYFIFEKLFDPMIDEIHEFKKDDKHPALDWGEPCKLPDVDPSGQMILSSKITCRRSIEGFPFAAIMSIDQYEEIMETVQCRTKCLKGELKGKFYALEEMDVETKKNFRDDNILFNENNPLLKTANATRFWPTGRGIFVNEGKTFAIWCNEEDHLLFISTGKGGNLREIYDRLINGVTQVSRDFQFVHDERLGFLTFSPENLGNSLKVSVELKLRKLPQNQEKFDELTGNLALRVSKLRVEEDCSIYEVSSTRRLGFTEFETVTEFSDGISELLRVDNSL